MAVVTPDGIVGKVIAAYPTASEVMLITDPEFAAGVVSQKNHVRGTLKGQGQATCKVDYVPSEEKVEVGEMFYTSGDDRMFPKGFPVGVVRVVRASSPYQEILVEPSGLRARPGGGADCAGGRASGHSRSAARQCAGVSGHAAARLRRAAAQRSRPARWDRCRPAAAKISADRRRPRTTNSARGVRARSRRTSTSSCRAPGAMMPARRTAMRDCPTSRPPAKAPNRTRREDRTSASSPRPPQRRRPTTNDRIRRSLPGRQPARAGLAFPGAGDVVRAPGRHPLSGLCAALLRCCWDTWNCRCWSPSISR